MSSWPDDSRIRPIGGKSCRVGEKFCSLDASFGTIGAGISSVDCGIRTIELRVLVRSTRQLAIDGSVRVIGDNQSWTGANVYGRGAGISTIGRGAGLTADHERAIGASDFLFDTGEARLRRGNGSIDSGTFRTGGNTPVMGSNACTARDNGPRSDGGGSISGAGDLVSSEKPRLTRPGIGAPHASVDAPGTNTSLTGDNMFAPGSKGFATRHRISTHGTNFS